MEKIIEKADILIEALPYIKRFFGKKIIIKFGGSTMSEKSFVRNVLEDIVFMKYVGMKPIIIHGGGPAISEEMKKKGLTPKFVNGLRVTDRETMDIVEDVLVNTINKEIVDILKSMDCDAEGICGREGGLITVTKHMSKRIVQEKEKTHDEYIDLGYVGEVEHINPIGIQEIKNKGKIPVIAPLGIGADGYSYNINGDIAAGEITAALGAEKIVFLTDIMGIMKDLENEESLISTLKVDEVYDLIKHGIIKGGMIPKVNACIKALKFGVQKAHMIDGRLSHSLLLEMFTNKGIGTEIVN